MKKVKLLGMFTAALVALTTTTLAITSLANDYQIGLIPTEAEAETLLGIDENVDDYMLGTASYFSVFVENDFGANGSDCEGRMAVGGGANLGDITWYNIGNHLAKVGDSSAALIVGEGPLQDVEISVENSTVIGATVDDSQIKIANQTNLYRADLIDFPAEFEKLRAASTALSKVPANGTTAWDSNWTTLLRFTGTDPVANVFSFTEEEWNAIWGANTALDFCVPDGSFVYINIAGTDVTMHIPSTVHFNGTAIAENDAPGSERILFNLYEATTFTYSGTGTMFGSTLAPNADGSDDMTSGAHVSGATIAKSYFGGIEFGFTNFRGPIIVTEPEETTTTTTTTTTTSTEPETTTTTTTTTSTEPETTTTTTTTSTEPETTTTTTTTTSTELETTTTTTTTSTEPETTTTTTTTSTESETTTTTTTTSTESETTTTTTTTVITKLVSSETVAPDTSDYDIAALCGTVMIFLGVCYGTRKKKQ